MTSPVDITDKLSRFDSPHTPTHSAQASSNVSERKLRGDLFSGLVLILLITAIAAQFALLAAME
ncbi:hypothetical protein [Cerasicoccus frondis]|uniref:hypothetical protein n=1 Tax=Cerasicoccus frondis TaxID=490090 RepID=UPI002852B836|nr:hypothetical protein [Cerasicoccus frondis]